MDVHLPSDSPERTREIGRDLGLQLRVGDVVALIGPLGAGKTQFVKGIAEGAGLTDTRRVTSPTFVLINEYEGGSDCIILMPTALGTRGNMKPWGRKNLPGTARCCSNGRIVSWPHFRKIVSRLRSK